MSSSTSHDNELEAFKVNAKRTDFSGIFRSVNRGEQPSSPAQNVATRRRRPREIIPLQFEPEFEDMDAKEEMSMEALHFFGLSNDLPSAPVTPKLFGSEEEESTNLKKRHRHFSLEDYNAMDESEDSSSSSSNLSQLSSGLNSLICSKRVRQNSIFSNLDDSAISFSNSSALSSSSASIESFSFGQQSRRNSLDFFSTNFLSDIPFSSNNVSALELDNDHIAHQLRSELETRLLETLCPAPGASASEVSGASRRKYVFELPPQLLAIIASHVIQEAANEPYGLKGCLLHIYYESETDNEFVASLDCDPETLSTFELTLTLRQDPCRRRGWRNKLPELVRSFSTFGFGSVLVGTSYKLVKKRNYRTNVDETEATTLLKL